MSTGEDKKKLINDWVNNNISFPTFCKKFGKPNKETETLKYEEIKCECFHTYLCKHCQIEIKKYGYSEEDLGNKSD